MRSCADHSHAGVLGGVVDTHSTKEEEEVMVMIDPRARRELEARARMHGTSPVPADFLLREVAQLLAEYFEDIKWATDFSEYHPSDREERLTKLAVFITRLEEEA